MATKDNNTIKCEDCGKVFNYFKEGGSDDKRCDSCWNKNQKNIRLNNG